MSSPLISNLVCNHWTFHKPTCGHFAELPPPPTWTFVCGWLCSINQ